MRRIFVCLLMPILASVALGQEFEVVSVKPNKTLDGSSHTHSDDGMLLATNVTLASLISRAYGLKGYQLEGPDWLSTEHFDIAAKYSEALPKDPDKAGVILQSMMRKMLAERFKLTAHNDKRTFAVYGLVVGKSGIKFKEAEQTESHNSNSNNNHYKGTSITMDRFAEFLSRRMDMPVVDMTGLTGYYDLTLDWVPEPRKPAESKAESPLLAESSTGRAIPEALQLQLGLKFETRKAPVEILIVDHIERVPTEN